MIYSIIIWLANIKFNKCKITKFIDKLIDFLNKLKNYLC
jgi:hypothetical protein